MTIKELMLKRYATKKFDPSYKLAKEDLDYILECARLSCSSANIQPWHITVVTNPEMRKKLQVASYGQPQVVDASVLLVYSVVKDLKPRIDRTASLIAQSAGEENAKKFRGMVEGWLVKEKRETIAWEQRQSFLALQAMILAAMERGIDSCPMEGFEPDKYVDILGATDIVPTALLTLGKALVPGFAKIRVPIEDIVRRVD